MDGCEVNDWDSWFCEKAVCGDVVSCNRRGEEFGEFVESPGDIMGASQESGFVVRLVWMEAVAVARGGTLVSVVELVRGGEWVVWGERDDLST